MSEVSRGGGAFAKVVQKTLARTRTKVLQRVGKAEKTTDEVYKDNIVAFQKQQASALRLQKEMKHYLSCVRAMSSAAKSFYAVLKETYEEDWYDPHSFNSSLNSLELLHTNYEAELMERVYTDVNEYMDQFPVYKEKMNKRNRKRLDYDNARHAYETVSTAKKPDHIKTSKAHEALIDTKSLFEEINNELHKELPRFHEYRIEFLANNLLRLCEAESTFHTNAGKVNEQLTSLLQTLSTTHAEEMERLNNAEQTKVHDVSHGSAGEGLDLSSLSPDVQSPIKSNGHGDGSVSRQNHRPVTNSSQKVSGSEEPEHRSRAPPPARPTAAPNSPSNTLPSSKSGNPFVTSDDETEQTSKPETTLDDSTAPNTEAQTSSNPFEDEEDAEEIETSEKLDQPTAEPVSAPVTDEPDADKTADSEPVSQEPVTNEPTVIVLPPSSTSRSDSKPSTSSISSTSATLYQVLATHPYAAEDEDELSFEAGEIINVVEYDGEDEQDDGWLMGINTKTLVKGVFPANFTQPIERKT